MKTITLPFRNSIKRSCRHCGTVAAFLVLLALACFALLPTARAVDPPPDGGYANQNTAEGEDALFSLTDGSNNTAIGYRAMYSDTRGFGNTAIGVGALGDNTAGSSNTAIGDGALLQNSEGDG